MFFLFISSFLISIIGDIFCPPYNFPRKIIALPFIWLPILLATLFFTMLTGNIYLGVILTSAIYLVLIIGTTIKNNLLKEPLVFTDLIIIPLFFKHPLFYLYAIPIYLRYLLLLIYSSILGIIIYYSHYNISLRLQSFYIFCIIFIIFYSLLRAFTQRLFISPNLKKDMKDFGLLPTLIIYWKNWKKAMPPPPKNILPNNKKAPHNLIIVQCESFTNPQSISQNWNDMPEFQEAFSQAFQYGRLKVNALGAHTMRTEYSVLFGNSDETLGLRQFDPYLTAFDHMSHALSQRLKNIYSHRVFIHPYDMNFYDRKIIIPKAGFTKIIDENNFTEADKIGPHISDQSAGHKVLQEVSKKNGFYYVVTMENHGPWDKNRLSLTDPTEIWKEHARHSMIMLLDLIKDLKQLNEDTLLIFFGDHHPVFPKKYSKYFHKTSDTTTPYGIWRFGKNIERKPNPITLTPSQLYNLILSFFS